MSNSEEASTNREISGLRFTPSGQKRMEEYQSQFTRVLRGSIRDQRNSFADKVIEVTAADVDRALEGVKLISTRKLELRKLVLDLYIALGVVLALIGFSYNYFRSILDDDPVRIALIFGGLLAIVFSLVARRLFKVINIKKTRDQGIGFFVSDFYDDISDKSITNRYIRNIIAHSNFEKLSSDLDDEETRRKIIDQIDKHLRASAATYSLTIPKKDV